jgi:hypothetical protein
MPPAPAPRRRRWQTTAGCFGGRGAQHAVLRKSFIVGTERVQCDDAGCTLHVISFHVHGHMSEPRASLLAPNACWVGVGRSCQKVSILLAARTPVLNCPPQHLQLPASRGGTHTFPHPTGSRAPAPTVISPGNRPQPRIDTWLHPNRSLAPPPTVISPGARPQRRMNT